MKLRERLDEIRQLAEKASPAHRVVVDCNAVLALLEVVEQQKNALHSISLASQNSMSSKEECGRIARAALSLMDKEES
jgi:hypothetical protein